MGSLRNAWYAKFPKAEDGQQIECGMGSHVREAAFGLHMENAQNDAHQCQTWYLVGLKVRNTEENAAGDDRRDNTKVGRQHLENRAAIEQFLKQWTTTNRIRRIRPVTDSEFCTSSSAVSPISTLSAN